MAVWASVTDRKVRIERVMMFLLEASFVRTVRRMMPTGINVCSQIIVQWN